VTGDQFVLAPNATFNDSNCTKSVPARLAFQAHSAPLDAKFDAKFENLYVTFHGSWDRDPATGYKLVAIPFTKGADGLHTPVAPSNSSSSYTDIWSNLDTGKCGAQQCFRPVSIAFDGAGRMYVTSDASGESEMWLVGKV
jgi:glucose/arabinose dehydrogenase